MELRGFEPLHAIDEPPSYSSAHIHAFPHVSAGQHTDGIETTRCGVRRREAWLLANCWQVEWGPGSSWQSWSPSQVVGGRSQLWGRGDVPRLAVSVRPRMGNYDGAGIEFSIAQSAVCLEDVVHREPLYVRRNQAGSVELDDLMEVLDRAPI